MTRKTAVLGALTLLEKVLQQLKAEQAGSDAGERFDALRPVLLGEPGRIQANAESSHIKLDGMEIEPVINGVHIQELARSLCALPAPPLLVFVTAYSRYAVEAFEVHALDYLLKPFTDARFGAALARAKQQVLERRRGVLDARIADLLRAQQAPRQRFLVPARG